MPTIEPWGKMPDGTPVQRVVLEYGICKAAVITYGAILQDLRWGPAPIFDAHMPDGDTKGAKEGLKTPYWLTLGFDSLEPYLTESPEFGAVIGRVANRIKGARFTLRNDEGVDITYKTGANFKGRHTIHGGSEGLGHVVWDLDLESTTYSRAVLKYRSRADNHMGFPGNVDVTCVYDISESTGKALVLKIELMAQTDAPTYWLPTHHAYFNLHDGGRTAVDDHEVQINAGCYLPSDKDRIPLGEFKSVERTPYDLRTPNRLGDITGQRVNDCYYCVTPDGSPTESLHTLATAWGPWKHEPSMYKLPYEKWRTKMTLQSTEPGVQLYDGHNMPDLIPKPGLDGISYKRSSGFCLEAHGWPDALNHEGFPPPARNYAVLRPGELRKHTYVYTFTREIRRTPKMNGRTLFLVAILLPSVCLGGLA